VYATNGKKKNYQQFLNLKLV